MDTVTVTISGESIELTPPTSPSQLFDLAGALGNLHSVAPGEAARTLCACLGVCWPARGAKALKALHHADPMVYGGRVFDELISRKASAGDIMSAAREAVGLVAQAQQAIFTAVAASKDKADFSGGAGQAQ